MPLTKLTFRPSHDGYMAEDGNEVMATALDGGASRYRVEVLNSTSRVSVKWTVRSIGFEYLRAFFNTIAQRGSLPFLIDLKLDKSDFTEHTAHFIPNTFKSNRLGGGKHYACTAQLEVVRIDPDEEYDESLVTLVNAFGPDGVDAGLLSLEYLVNTAMPDAVPA